MACPHKYHREYLDGVDLESIFGSRVEIYLSVDSFREKWLMDPVVSTVVEELGAVINV
jgi:hypothetical protein